MQFYHICTNSSRAFSSADSTSNRTQNPSAANAPPLLLALPQLHPFLPEAPPLPLALSWGSGGRNYLQLGEKTRIPSHQQEIGRKGGGGSLGGRTRPALALVLVLVLSRTGVHPEHMHAE